MSEIRCYTGAGSYFAFLLQALYHFIAFCKKVLHPPVHLKNTSGIKSFY